MKVANSDPLYVKKMYNIGNVYAKMTSNMLNKILNGPQLLCL